MSYTPINGITPRDSRTLTSGVEEVAGLTLDRADKLLAGIPGGVYRAVGSAFKRAAEHGKTVGMKFVSEEYAIGQNDLKKHTENINTIVRDQDGDICVTFGYKGHVIPLLRFDTHVTNKGCVTTRVVRNNTKQALDHAFRAQVNGHIGIFEREGKERTPIREIFGPSAVQAFYAREEVVDRTEDAMIETYEKRIDHEISVLLNGWR